MTAPEPAAESDTTGESDGFDIVVVGSINLDLALSVDRLPAPGETVLGLGLQRGGGGKGANQAVAAARLGRRVAMVGRVGADDDGRLLSDTLAEEGVDTSGVSTWADGPTGLAVIEVDRAGENRIVVIPGANAAVDHTDLDRSAAVLAAAPVVLTQLEIPPPVVERLATGERRGRCILNPAPAQPVSMAGVDIVVPNQTELAILVGAEPATGVDEAVDQARLLAKQAAGTDGGRGLDSVVVTLGGDGAVVVDGLRAGPGSVDRVAAQPVAVVDTTGAGDAFCAGLADALCLGADVGDAARWAARVAAIAVTRTGTWSAFPRRHELLA
jgi:ribokinase